MYCLCHPGLSVMCHIWGAVAEWVERRSLNPEVLGSNEIPPTPFRILGKFVYPTLP